MSIFNPSIATSIEPMKSENESEITPEIINQDELSISNKTFKWSLCPKEFSNKKALRKHLRLHLSIRSYKCTLCSKSYKRSDHLNRHMLTHSDKNNIYKCPYCDFSFYLKYHLKSHLNNIHVMNPFKFKCEFCGEFFPKKIKLLKHQRHEHKEQININKVNCYYPYCHKEYIHQEDLLKHIAKDHQNTKVELEDEKEENQTNEETVIKEKKFFKCPYENCLKTYSTSFNLNTHIKSFHLKIKAFTCEICKLNLSHKSSLKRHMEKTHHKQLNSNSEEVKEKENISELNLNKSLSCETSSKTLIN